MSGLSLKEENDMRVEHALEILKADVSHSAWSTLHAVATHAHVNQVTLPCILHHPHTYSSATLPRQTLYCVAALP